MTTKQTWRQEVEAAAGGEPIEAVVMGPHSWRDADPVRRHNVLLTWTEAVPLLDIMAYPPEPMYAWTASLGHLRL